MILCNVPHGSQRHRGTEKTKLLSVFLGTRRRDSVACWRWTDSRMMGAATSLKMPTSRPSRQRRGPFVSQLFRYPGKGGWTFAPIPSGWPRRRRGHGAARPSKPSLTASRGARASGAIARATGPSSLSQRESAGRRDMAIASRWNSPSSWMTTRRVSTSSRRATHLPASPRTRAAPRRTSRPHGCRGSARTCVWTRRAAPVSAMCRGRTPP